MDCVLVQIKIKDGLGGFQYYRINTSPYDVVFDSNTFTSAGEILSIGDYEELTEVDKTGLDIQLSGIDPAIQADIDSGAFIRAPIDIIIAYVPDGDNVVSTYAYHHRGYCDSPITKIDYESNTVTLNIETTNVFTDIDREPDLNRSSMATHSARHNGDKFFQYTADGETEETWRR